LSEIRDLDHLNPELGLPETSPQVDLVEALTVEGIDVRPFDDIDETGEGRIDADDDAGNMDEARLDGDDSNVVSISRSETGA
ncbi:MAG TPA: hypothetical protein VLD39_01645, partial [Gammaproteobacteria bacterium]|nr:hypothetical protein [Gammaproteobacteria bacterium]